MEPQLKLHPENEKQTFTIVLKTIAWPVQSTVYSVLQHSSMSEENLKDSKNN